jgi:hypothetical protein
VFGTTAPVAKNARHLLLCQRRYPRFSVFLGGPRCSADERHDVLPAIRDVPESRLPRACAHRESNRRLACRAISRCEAGATAILFYTAGVAAFDNARTLACLEQAGRTRNENIWLS